MGGDLVVSADKLSGMRAVTLLQPWASLVMERVKLRETRSTPFLRGAAGQTIILHSSARVVPRKMMTEELHELCIDVFGCAYNSSLPLGSGLGLLQLGHTLVIPDIGPLTEEDRIAGDWKHGRFATDIKNAAQFQNLIPAKGMLGLWKWKTPESLAA